MPLDPPAHAVGAGVQKYFQVQCPTHGKREQVDTRPFPLPFALLARGLYDEEHLCCIPELSKGYLVVFLPSRAWSTSKPRLPAPLIRLPSL